MLGVCVCVRACVYADYVLHAGAHSDDHLYDDLSGALLDAINLEKQLPLIRAVAIFRDVTPACTVECKTAPVRTTPISSNQIKSNQIQPIPSPTTPPTHAPTLSSPHLYRT